jgi:hypothetical protein
MMRATLDTLGDSTIDHYTEHRAALRGHMTQPMEDGGSYTPQRSEESPLAFSRRQTAQKLNISIRTVDNMRARGELRAVHYGGRTMIPEVEISRLLKVSGHETPKRFLSSAEVWAADHSGD